MFRVITLVFSKEEHRLLGAYLSSNTFESRPSRTTLNTYTNTIKEKFLCPEYMVIESHPVVEGSYVNIHPVEVLND